MSYRVWLPLVLLAGVALAGAWPALDWYLTLEPGRTPTYVGSAKCAQCHQTEHDQWQGSHHQLAMAPASPETVAGDFNDRTLEHKNAKTGESYGVTSRFFRKDGRYYVHTEGPHGEPADFEVKYTFGVKPLQQYLVDLGRGKLQALSVAWNTETKAWFLLDMEGERIKPGDPQLGPLHWTGRLMNWNHMCADCHSTNVDKGYDLARDEYHTTYSEVSVGCEACHGPGSLHLELADNIRTGRSLYWDRLYGFGLARLKTADSKPQLESCAKCHARRQVIEPQQRPGHELLDHYVPELLDTAVYHEDGQIRASEEAFEYGSFLQSKMFRKGVRCTDCHHPHTAQLKAEGNALCARCHTKSEATGVLFDSPAHHFHPAGSRGAQCVECHMPATTYMLVDPRRDHSIRIPRPDVSVEMAQKFGVDLPNACNRCHKPEGDPAHLGGPRGDARWAADKINAWYGPERVKVRDKHPHFGLTLAAGRRGDTNAAAELARITETPADYGPIVRATAVQLLERFPTGTARDAIREAANADEPLLRYAGLGATQGFGRDARLELLRPKLADKVRGVRFQAMRMLTSPDLRSDRGGPADEPEFAAVWQEYVQAVRLANNDQAGAHYELGLLYANLQDDGRAEQEYRQALRLDPGFQAARGALAALYRDRNDRPAAEALLREGIKLLPKSGAPYFELGLFLAEDKARMADAVAALRQAVELDPNQALFHYNLALTLLAQGQPADARTQLEASCKLEPDAPRHWLALALLAVEQGDWPVALRAAEQAAHLQPEAPLNTFVLAAALAYSGKQTEALPRLGQLSSRHLAALLQTFQREQRRTLALVAVDELLRREPQNPQLQQLRQTLLRPAGP